MVRVHNSMRSPDAIASRSMVRASRCMRWVQLDCVLLKRPQQQLVSDPAPRDHVDLAPEDQRELVTETHECAEVVDVCVHEVHQDIDVAAGRVEVRTCRGPNDCER